MKNSILILVLSLSFTVNVKSQDLELLDNDNGFLGIKFCQDIDSVRRIITPVAISGDENEKSELYRVIKKQYYAFGTAQFKLFTINFFNNKLLMQSIEYWLIYLAKPLIISKILFY